MVPPVGAGGHVTQAASLNTGPSPFSIVSTSSKSARPALKRASSAASSPRKGPPSLVVPTRSVAAGKAEEVFTVSTVASASGAVLIPGDLPPQPASRRPTARRIVTHSTRAAFDARLVCRGCTPTNASPGPEPLRARMVTSRRKRYGVAADGAPSVHGTPLSCGNVHEFTRPSSVVSNRSGFGWCTSGPRRVAATPAHAPVLLTWTCPRAQSAAPFLHVALQGTRAGRRPDREERATGASPRAGRAQWAKPRSIPVP